MRLLVVAPTLPVPPSQDGQTLILYHQLKELARHHAITVLCFDGATTEHIDVVKSWGITVELIPRPAPSRFTQVAPGRYGWFAKRWWSPMMADRVAAMTQRPQPDVVVLHSPFMAAYAEYCGDAPCIINAIDAHGELLHELARVETSLLKKKYLRREATAVRRLERELYPKVKAVTVVTERDRQLLLSSGVSGQIVVTPNGVDTEFFHPGQTQVEPATLLFSGTMDYPPNVAAARWFYQHVWPRLKSLRPSTRWLIVGQRPTSEIRALGTHDAAITVTGRVDDLRPFFWQATVAIAPVEAGTGVKNKILEAMACGCPVVADPVCLSGITAEPGRDLLTAASPDAWATIIDELFNRPERCRSLGQHGRQAAETQSWSASTAAYLQTYTYASHA